MATNNATSATSCSEHQVSAAIFGQRPLIGTLIKERMVKQRKYTMRRVKEGSMLDPHDDSRSVIINRGLAQAVGYTDYQDPFLDDCDGPQVKPGQLTGQSGCNDSCGTVNFDTLVNKTAGGACDPGVQIVDYSQGFEYRDFEDARIQISTPERCIETLAQRERKHVADYIEQEAAFLAETAFLSYDRKLTDLAIKNGSANSVVETHLNGEPTLTGGGWNPGLTPNDPQLGVRHVTIYWLERYREQIIERLMAATVPGAEDYVLEVEMTREAWKFALVTESLTRTGDGGMVNGLGEQIRLHAKLEEKTYGKGDMMMGRKFDTWDGKIRVIFNDKPIRGFLRQTGSSQGGQTTFNFIRVNEYINEESEVGVRTIANPDYRRNTVECDGQTYPLLELIPHIHKDSFTRHNLTQGIGPSGVNPLMANFTIQLLKDQYLSDSDCPNYGNKKYRYYMEHKFRWKNTRNEFSGYIMHRRYILPGYDADIINQELVVKSDQANATPRECEVGEVEKCDPTCPDEICDADTNTLEMRPCGAVETSFVGDAKPFRIAVDRAVECSTLAAEVTYGVTEGTALKGTHYEVVDADGNVAPATGSLSWEAGEFGTKYICLKITGALENDADTKDECCTDVMGNANPATFVVGITGPTGTNLGDCSEVKVSINNRA